MKNMGKNNHYLSTVLDSSDDNTLLTSKSAAGKDNNSTVSNTIKELERDIKNTLTS